MASPNFDRVAVVFFLAVALLGGSLALAEQGLRLGRFNIDATPPLGSPLAYNRMTKEGGKLSCRGIVLLPRDQQAIVLAAIDWIGVGNDGYSEFRKALAKGAGTVPERVAFHSLHQHDAPRCDFSADAILAENGLAGEMFDVKFARQLLQQLEKAVEQATGTAVPINHLGFGEGEIEMVASNRRILGDDGRVKYTRYTATKDPTIRAFPAGTIDPMCKLIAFFNGEKPVAALTYYATHPQSYYRTGETSPDFPGIARNLRDESIPEVLHIHFNGAGGNIGAGKWNDGAKENRIVLARRVEAGMSQAWEASLKNRQVIDAADIRWTTEPVALPVSELIGVDQLLLNVADEQQGRTTRIRSSVHLAWLRRCEEGHRIDTSCLTLGKVRIIHMPGELFVEYQLAAQKLRPDLFVAMAAYGDYAPGYIGTAVAYGQGGYETNILSSRVSPRAESVLLKAIHKLLE